jgi:hypothetical protein
MTPQVKAPKIKRAIRSTVLDTLRGCDIPFPTKVDDSSSLEAAALAVAAQRGYYADVPESVLAPVVVLSAQAVFHMYKHLDSNLHELRIMLTLYFVWLYYFDDNLHGYYDAITEFNDRFIRSQPQKHRALDHFATTILELSERYPTAARNIIVTGSLDSVTGLLVEDTFRSEKVGAFNKSLSTLLIT